MRDEMRRGDWQGWHDVTFKEMCHFLGLVMLMELVRLPETQLYWAWRRSFSMNTFGHVMPRSRFKTIRCYFHKFNEGYRGILSDQPVPNTLISQILLKFGL